MWRCECNYKNNNSKMRCGKCEKIREGFKPKDIPISKREIIRDYCPVCKKHTNFKKVNKQQYSCQSCHKKFKMIGPPISELPTDQRIDAIKAVELIHTEQIKIAKSLESQTLN